MSSGTRAADLRARVVAHLAKGRARLAATLVDEVPESARDAEFHALAGAVASAQGDAARAIEHFQRALAGQAQDPGARRNLATALLRAGRAADARPHLDAALAIAPADDALWLTRGAVDFALGDFAGAEAAFTRAEALAPGVASARGLGDCARAQRQVAAALAAYERAHARAPEDVATLRSLAPLRLNAGDPEGAIAAARRAVAHAPGDATTHRGLGYCLREAGDLDEAMDAYAQALAIDPADALAACQVAECWLALGDADQAHHWVDRAESLAPGRPGNRLVAVKVWLAAGMPEAARALAEDLVAAHPELDEAWLALAQARWDDDDAEGAVAACAELLARRPQAAFLEATVGDVLSSAGRLEQALEAYARALALHPGHVGALCGTALGRRADTPEPILAEMRARLAEPLPDSLRTALQAALAQVADARGDHAGAVEALQRANALQWRRRQSLDWDYDPAAFHAEVDAIRAHYDAAHFARWRDAGHPDPRPVFVVGMPRSGTTLTERILAAHPAGLGVGERPFVPRAARALADRHDVATSALPSVFEAETLRAAGEGIAGELARLAARDGRGEAAIAAIVDKLPDNVYALGFIASVLPRARIVHVSRDPRDIAVSCWITAFAQVPWACHLEHIAERLVAHARMLAHWREVLPVPIHALRYEDLVADPEAEVRRLLAFLGLPWDPACLAFPELSAPVRSASILQVRRPVYRSSAGRWRRYAFALSPLVDRLAAAGLLPPDATDGQTRDL